MDWPSTEYQKYLVFMNNTGYKGFPGATPHEEHDVKTSASDVHVQYKIWMLPLPTDYLIIKTPHEEHDVKRQRLTYMFNI